MRAKAVVVFVVFCLSACTGLPPRTPVPSQQALPPSTTSALQRQVAPMVRAHPGVSGFVVLESGLSAFASRAWMVESADRSLDIQCYIWRTDRTGQWLIQQLAAAAARGVRVRLLLDDNNSSGLDPVLAQLDALDNVEVRLFNPYPNRGLARMWDLATDFDRLNRRMHIKTFIADGHAAIFGGRNVGDEYFDATADVAFADMDVLALGPLVADVVKSFDAYWNSKGAYPLRDIVRDADAGNKDRLAVGPATDEYVEGLRARKEVAHWRKGPRADELVWGPSILTVDPPDKIFEQAHPRELMMTRLVRAIGDVDKSFDLVSPYFVPMDEGVELFADLEKRGVRVRILTNSLAATDVAAVHAGYAPWRPALLQAGIELYEIRRSSDPQLRSHAPWRTIDWSRASLHAKTFAIDSRRVFIGSFNFDPRSAWLNSEIGVLIDHGALAKRINQVFDNDVPKYAWRVTEAADGKLQWTVQGDTGAKVVDQEPEASIWRRIAATVLSWFPIEWLL